MIKMIVFDLDGTLLNSKKEVTNESKNYLRKLKQQGYILVVATGRIYSHALQALKDFSFLNYIITDAGSSIYDLSTNKAIYKKTISKRFLKYVVKDYNQNYHYIDICNKNNIYKYADYVENNDIVITSKDISFIIKNCKDISHISISLNQQKLVYPLYEKLKKEKKTLEYLLMQDSFSEKKWIEIFPKGCSKYNAIEKLAKYLKIKNEEIICFGDGLNDMEMLKKSNNGIAMKNALPEVKKISKDVTKFDNDHDGIIKYLMEKLSC